MKLEDQVSNLELSKRLKELGMKQESYWHWHRKLDDPELRKYGLWCIAEPEKEKDCYSAFTVAELISILGDKFGVLERFMNNKGFGAYIPRDCGVNGIADTPANALAKLLIEVWEG